MTVPLHFREYGAGEPLLILHGLLGNAQNWLRPAKALAKQHRVFTLDLRNHGRSPHADSMGLMDMAADVRAFMAENGLEEAAVIGHSLGGKVAMVLALESPELISRLLVVDIAPVRYDTSDLDGIVEALQGLDLDSISSLGQADERLAESLPDPKLRSFLLTNLKAGPNGYAWRVNLDGIAAAVPAVKSFPEALDAASYPGPTLFAAGGKSHYIESSQYAAIAQHFPQAVVGRIAGAGHWLHAEKPEPFMAMAAPFLDGDGLSTGPGYELEAVA